MQLAHGNASCIYNLSSQKAQSFFVYEEEVADSLFKITYLGNQLYHERVTADQNKVIANLDGQINTLAKKLSAIFQLTPDKQTILSKAAKT